MLKPVRWVTPRTPPLSEQGAIERLVARQEVLLPAPAGPRHVDPNRLRHNWGVVRHVVFVAKQQLQRMPS
jgi:hypothetical protein